MDSFVSELNSILISIGFAAFLLGGFVLKAARTARDNPTAHVAVSVTWRIVVPCVVVLIIINIGIIRCIQQNAIVFLAVSIAIMIAITFAVVEHRKDLPQPVKPGTRKTVKGKFPDGSNVILKESGRQMIAVETINTIGGANVTRLVYCKWVDTKGREILDHYFEDELEICV